MPDANGNLTMSDMVAFKQGLSAMRNDRETRRYRDAQEDMIDQYGSVAGAVEGADPSAMNQYQLHAYKSFSDNYNTAMDTKRNSEVHKAKAGIMDGIKQSGDVFGFFNQYQPTTEAELQAAAQIREGFSNNMNFQKQMFANRAALADAKYKEAQTVLGQAEIAATKGDAVTAGRLIEGMSRNVPMRGQYHFDDKTGLLHRMYLSREKGWVDTGETMSVPDFLKFAKGFNQQEFSAQVATQMKATGQFNREQILKGGQQAIGPNGEKLSVYAQINPAKFDDIHYIVHDQSGQQLGTFTAEQLHQNGVRVRDIEMEQKEANLTHTKQTTATSAAAQKSHEATEEATRATTPLKTAKANADLTKALQDVEKGNLDAGRKALKDLLLPFADKGATQMDPETFVFSNSGKNALREAQATITKARNGEQVAPTNLEAAKGAVALFNKISTAHKGKYNLAPSQSERAQIDEMKLLVKQFGPDRAKAIWAQKNGKSAMRGGR